MGPMPSNPCLPGLKLLSPFTNQASRYLLLQRYLYFVLGPPTYGTGVRSRNVDLEALYVMWLPQTLRNSTMQKIFRDHKKMFAWTVTQSGFDRVLVYFSSQKNTKIQETKGSFVTMQWLYQRELCNVVQQWFALNKLSLKSLTRVQ